METLNFTLHKTNDFMILPELLKGGENWYTDSDDLAKHPWHKSCIICKACKMRTVGYAVELFRKDIGISVLDKPCAAGARSTTCHPTSDCPSSRFKIFKIQEVYRIGHVNPTLHYVRKSKDAQIVAGFTFSHFSKKCHQNVFKTCQKRGPWMCLC